MINEVQRSDITIYHKVSRIFTTIVFMCELLERLHIPIVFFGTVFAYICNAVKFYHTQNSLFLLSSSTWAIFSYEFYLRWKPLRFLKILNKVVKDRQIPRNSSARGVQPKLFVRDFWDLWWVTCHRQRFSLEFYRVAAGLTTSEPVFQHHEWESDKDNTLQAICATAAFDDKHGKTDTLGHETGHKTGKTDCTFLFR